MKVISAFAGLGKTTVGKKYNNVIDLQSSIYHYDYTNIDAKDYEKMKYNNYRKINSSWPDNYIKAIKEAIKKYDIVLVPSNKEIRELLEKNNIEFIFVFPSIDSKDELIKRYIKRGNTQNLIDNVMVDFNNWSRNQKDYTYPIVILDKNKYLEDLLIEMNLL